MILFRELSSLAPRPFPPPVFDRILRFCIQYDQKPEAGTAWEREATNCPSILCYVPNTCILGTRPFMPHKNGFCCKLELVRANRWAESVFVLRYSCNLSAVGCSPWSGTVRPVSLIAVVPTVPIGEISSICFPWATGTQFLPCCISVQADAFMPASLVVIP